MCFAIYEFEIKTESGKVVDVEINAETSEIVKAEKEGGGAIDEEESESEEGENEDGESEDKGEDEKGETAD